MIAGRHITKAIALLTALAAALCIAASCFSGQLAAAAGEGGVQLEYQRELFDVSKPISVNILMDSGDWDAMLQNAVREEYVSCDVEINGQTFYRVGIRPKGNTSLTSIAGDPDTDRFSFKLEFDQYVEGQTCFGLDKLILNNNYADATNMKEALVYDMYRWLGADASLYNYAEISVNGEYWGLYLALEAVEDSFLLRNYGVKSGALYKPESMGMGGGGGGFDGQRFSDGDLVRQFEANQAGQEPPQQPEGGPGESPAGPFEGRSMGSGGADLNYIDDELDSYSTIWEGEVGSTSQSDRQRVVEALKNISEGRDLEAYMDVDNLIKYAAVHMFSVNEDSLSGTMAHNYYLYEYQGRLNLLPWDYNLAFGGMHGESASDVVNDPIDDIFTGTHFFDAMMENPEYLARYHEALGQLADYVSGGGFEEFYSRVRSQIDSLAEKDPTAFYTYEEYQQAVKALRETIELRGMSVAGQLDGSVPSTEESQRQDPSALIDTAQLELSVMGGMDMGGGPAERSAQSTGEETFSGRPSQAPGGAVPEGPQKETPPSGEGGENTGPNSGLVTYGICFAILLAALLFAGLFRRRSRKR